MIKIFGSMTTDNLEIKDIERKKRCPNGERKNTKTNKCEKMEEEIKKRREHYEIQKK
jgi:hypothetical protein